MKRLSIAMMVLLSGCATQQQRPAASTIPHPAPEDATPTGIAYLCDGRKEVAVVYAKNRATVTLDNKTWRMEYQPTGQGFRYVDAGNEWIGRADLVTLRANGGNALAFNCRPMRRTT